MAGTFTMKSLADGQLAVAKATLYTVPAVTSTLVLFISVTNTTTNTRNINLYVKRSGSVSRRIIPTDLKLSSGANYLFDGRLPLSTGDLIEGDASVATSVDFTIGGVEET